MKANELMIGDWVASEHEYLRVEELLEGIVKLSGNQGSVYHRLEPIPLTAEILAKNGWIVREANKMGVVIFTQHFEFCDKLLGIKDSIVSRIDCDPYGDFHYMCNGKSFCYINSVHELQHVLPLLGIDKKIVL